MKAFKRTLWLGVFAAALFRLPGYAAEQIPVVVNNFPGSADAGLESRYAVAHAHAASQCIGYLYVSPTRVRFEVVQPASDKRHSVDLSRSDITVIQPWTLLGTAINAVELKTAKANYHFWLLPETADLAKTSPKQWGVANALPSAALLAAIRGQAGGMVTGVAAPPIGVVPGAPYPAYPAAGGGAPSGVIFNAGTPAPGVPYPGPYPAYPTAGAGAPAATMPNVAGPFAGASAQSLPELRYNAPANFYKSANRNPEDYSSSQVNASMQVYPFRSFGGDISQQFQRTLLREWIDPRYQEANAAPPSFSRIDLQGAQMAVVARFLENVTGTMKEHMRVLIVADGAAAVVDLSANSATSWQDAAPAMLASLSSATVVRGSAATDRGVSLPASSAPPTASFAGLYMGSKQRYMATGLGPVGTGTFVSALHFYLLAPDGRMYRTYDPPPGNVRSFDYATAQRNDSENSGCWAQRGNQIVIQVGGPQPEQVIGTISTGGGFTVAGVLYGKQD